MKVTIKLEGAQALQAAIRRQPELLKTQTASAVAASTSAIAQTARSLAPASTGQLRRSIMSTSQGVAIGDSAPYWRHIEYGTRFMVAQPFLRPAAEQGAVALEGAVRDIAQALEQSWKDV